MGSERGGCRRFRQVLCRFLEKRYACKRFLLALLLLVLLLSGLGFLWLDGAFLPAWTSWEEKDFTGDVDGDGIPERLILKNRRFRILRESGEGVEIPLKYFYKISDAFCMDMNRDGLDEVLLLVWKRGRYGTYRPFWIEREDLGFSQHVFIYQYHEGAMHRYWMSSDVGMEICKASMDGDARLHLFTTDGKETVWGWEPYALKLVAVYPS